MNDIVIDQRLINLNSANAVQNNGTMLSDVLFKFRNMLREDDDIYYITCGVQNAQIPVSFYNISTNNNVLKYSVNAVNYSLTITPGFYNSTSFATAFAATFALGGHGQSLTVSINKLTGCFIVTLSLTYTLVFQYTSSTMFSVLGLPSGANYTISTTNANTLTYPCNLLGVLKVKICSSALTNYSIDSTSMTPTNLLQTISVSDAAFGITIFQNQVSYFARMREKKFSEIDIQLRDENDNLLNFANVNWSMTLQLNIYRRLDLTNNMMSVPALDLASKTTVSPTEAQIPPPEQQPEEIPQMEHTDDDLDTLLYDHIL